MSDTSVFFCTQLLYCKSRHFTLTVRRLLKIKKNVGKIYKKRQNAQKRL